MQGLRRLWAILLMGSAMGGGVSDVAFGGGPRSPGPPPPRGFPPTIPPAPPSGPGIAYVGRSIGTLPVSRPAMGRQPLPVRTGTALDAAWTAMALTDKDRERVNAALVEWKAKTAEAGRQLMARRLALTNQMNMERNPVKRNDLWRQLMALKPPTDLELYRSARQTLAEVLSADQLVQVDEAAKSAILQMVTANLQSTVRLWKAFGVSLTADQQTQVDRTAAVLQRHVDALEPGDRNTALALMNVAVHSVHSDVLTHEQRLQLLRHPSGGATFIWRQATVTPPTQPRPPR
jgi:hypothetical protein